MLVLSCDAHNFLLSFMILDNHKFKQKGCISQSVSGNSGNCFRQLDVNDGKHIRKDSCMDFIMSCLISFAETLYAYFII